MTDANTISPATLADASDIAAIYGHYVVHSTATFETRPPDVTEMVARIGSVLGEGLPWLVARDADGQVQGFAYAARFHARGGYRYSCETSIYVHPDAKGKGLGTALMTALVASCEGAGLRQAFAIIAGTEPASVVLHARMGYRPCGTLEKAGRKHGQWIDVFYMQRPLGEGGNTPPPEEP